MSQSNGSLKVVVLYVYPVFGGEHDLYAKRFVEFYKKCPALEPHELWVVSNGGEPTATMREVLAGLPANFTVHDDLGWDIGAYLHAARKLTADVMVFLGGNSYPIGAGWLRRMMDVWRTNGPALYGASASGGNGRTKPNKKGKRPIWPHIRTTGFWMPPHLLAKYPHAVTSERANRFLFEHGPQNMTAWVMSQGFRTLMVTWDGIYGVETWKGGAPNGYRSATQSALLVGDRCTGDTLQPQER